MFFILDFDGFWRQNDVIRLTAKDDFPLMPQEVPSFERTCKDELKCEILFKKLKLLANYWALISEFPAFLLLFLETLVIFKMPYFLKSNELFK